MQTNRLFDIVYILLDQKRTTAKALADRFGVSQRTIYRDVDTLSLSGIPVYTEKGKGGGISLLPDFVLNKSILSEGEQNEILSALQGLANIRTDETNQLLQKLSIIFNKTAVSWLEVDFTEWSYKGGEAFNRFKTAILERRIVEFDYYSTQMPWADHTQSQRPIDIKSSENRTVECESLGGKSTDRKPTDSEKPRRIAERRHVEPLQLWFKSKAWYLKGFCLLRQDVRLFKLSRVRNLAVTDTVFAKRNLLALPPNPGPVAHQKQDVTLKLKIAPEMTYRVFDDFDEDDTEKQSDGSFVVTVTWPEDEWVYGTILSYGEYAEVLEPAHIREIIKNKLLITAKKYI